MLTEIAYSVIMKILLKRFHSIDIDWRCFKKNPLFWKRFKRGGITDECSK